jgi:hypothetical protein
MNHLNPGDSLVGILIQVIPMFRHQEMRRFSRAYPGFRSLWDHEINPVVETEEK